MAETFFACSDRLIMYTSSADRHYFRVEPASGSMIIDNSSPVNGNWSTASTSISRTQTYAYNYLPSGATDNAYSTAPTFAFSSGGGASTLRSSTSAGGCIYEEDVGSSGCTIYMRGWAWYPSTLSSMNVNLYVYQGGSVVKSTTKTLSTMVNSGWTVSGLDADTTYYVYAYAGTVDDLGYSWQMGYDYFTTSSARPSNFSWTNTHGAGYACTTLTASEWNSLCSKVNEFRIYKGLSTINFTSATSGGTFTYAMFNEIRNAIYAMNSSGCPSTVSSGDTVYWSNIDALRTTLNAIT